MKEDKILLNLLKKIEELQEIITNFELEMMNGKTISIMAEIVRLKDKIKAE